MNAPQRVALLTGASSGIGRASAEALAREGFTVALAARRADRLDAVRAAIEASGGTGRAFPIDLERPGAPGALVRGVAEALGRIDVLVNNAGWGYCAPLSEIPEAAARRIFELNFTASFLMMREALPHLRRTRGVIVNIASVAGLLPSPYYAAYAASKAALVSAGDALRIEERDHGVRVVTVCPGPVTTEFGAVAGGAPVHADRVGVRVQSAEEIGRIVARVVLRPRRTVITAGVVRIGVMLHRFAPPLFEALALRWARRLYPEIERGL